jgi:hypothetical protein
MFAGKSLVELASEIQRQAQTKRDFVSDTRNLSMLSDSATGNFELRLDLSDGAASVPRIREEYFPMRDTAHRQIRDRLQIPAKYYDRCRTDAPALLATQVNHWFDREPQTRMVRTLDGEARAFLSDRYRPLDNMELLESVLPKVTDIGAEIVSCDVTDTKLYVKAIAPSIEGEVPNKVGDVVQAGLIIENSEIGMGALSVYPMVYRLACLNGMKVPDYGQRRNHIGKHTGDGADSAREFYRDSTLEADDRAFFMKVRDTVDHVLTADVFGNIVAKMGEATEKRITGDPVKAVEVTAKAFALNDTEKSGVLRHLIEGGDLSAYGLSNAITRQSQESETYDRASELEAIGYKAIEIPQTDWRAIAEAT